MSGPTFLQGYDPPSGGDETARYYGYLFCPFCCNTSATSDRKLDIGWFASLSSITYEYQDLMEPFDPLTCSRYAASLAPLLIISPLRLVWLYVCMKYLRAFRSRVESNRLTQASFSSSKRASCIQIDDFSPLAHLSDAQLSEFVVVLSCCASEWLCFRYFSQWGHVASILLTYPEKVTVL